MECLAATAAISIVRRPTLSCPFFPIKKKCGGLKLRLRANDIKLNFNYREDDDPLFRDALTRASIQPLFVDPYAGCFLPPNIEMDVEYHQHQYQYCLATRFIDDRLLSVTKKIDGVKQVVLLTDGMETRPYRLNWPTSTMIFDISPEVVFRRAAQKLEGGLFFHVPLESSNIQQSLRSKGFTGNRPSIWVLQGIPVTNLTSFKEILFMVSSLAMKGCLFLGELPDFLTDTEIGIKSTTTEKMEKIFMNYGFRVDMIGYEEVARNLGKEPALGDNDSLIFIAEHLRFSDDQMETWRREFQRIEEDGDEEGFEEL
ncbi:hypothetical protein LguiA_011368 [Lonicera macranthoides]